MNYGLANPYTASPSNFVNFGAPAVNAGTVNSWSSPGGSSAGSGLTFGSTLGSSNNLGRTGGNSGFNANGPTALSMGLPTVRYGGAGSYSNGQWSPSTSAGYSAGTTASWAGGSNPSATPWGTSTGGSSPNTFNTLNNVKSGQFQSGLNNLATGINSQTFNPNSNPNVLFQNTKNPAIAGAVNNITGNLNSYQNPTDFTKSQQLQGNVNSSYGAANNAFAQNQGTYNNYLGTFNAQTPQVTSNVQGENAALNNIYNGGLQGQLDQNAAKENAAVNLSGQQALANINRNSSAQRLSGGNSSYNNALALNTEAGVYSQEALRQADLQRNNLQYVQGMQNQEVGAQNNNLEGLANRALQPASALNSLTGAYQGQLTSAGNLDLANNIYTTPQQQGQNQLGLLSGASGISNANTDYTLTNPQQFYQTQSNLLNSGISGNNQNNFYGLGQNYSGNTSGYPVGGGISSRPTGSYGGGGGGWVNNFSGGGNSGGGYGQPQQGPQNYNNGLPSDQQGSAYQYGTPAYYAGVNSLGAANAARNNFQPSNYAGGYGTFNPAANLNTPIQSGYDSLVGPSQYSAPIGPVQY